MLRLACPIRLLTRTASTGAGAGAENILHDSLYPVLHFGSSSSMAAQLVSSAYCGKQQSVPVLALHSSACFRLHSTRLHAGASVRYSRQRTLNFASEVPARLIVRATQRESPAESSGRPGAEHSGASVPLTVPSVQNLAQKIAKGAAIAAFALALVHALLLALLIRSCFAHQYLAITASASCVL